MSASAAAERRFMSREGARTIKPHAIHTDLRSPSRATTLACIECRRPWDDARERWRLKVTDEQPPETVPYCPECATREFGPARPARREVL